MTAYVHRTMITTAALAPLARSLATGLAGPAGEGMWVAGLSPTGGAPATHYVSTGMIEDIFVAVLVDPDLMFQQAQQAGASVTLAQCRALVEGSDVSEEDPFSAFGRLGLVLLSQGS